METLKQAPRGAEGTPPGRLQVDRHRGHVAVRRLRLQPRGHAHRAGGRAQSQRREGLGPARVPRLRHGSRARHPQHQDGAAPIAALRARGRARDPRPGRHHPLDREERRLAGPQDGPGAAQRGEGAALPRRGRLDGRPRPGRRGALLRGAHRIQEPRALLLPQLRLRDRCGRTIAGAASASPRSTSCASTATTTSSSSWATPR